MDTPARFAAAAAAAACDVTFSPYSMQSTHYDATQSGQFSEDMIPTVGFNMRKITKGNVTIKVWDIGGQPRFRSMWERYCRGVNAIVYVPNSKAQ